MDKLSHVIGGPIQQNFDQLVKQWEQERSALETRIAALENPPRARVFNSANISVANATFQALTFNSERYDSAGLHSTVSNTERLTVTEAGLYTIGVSVQYAANATGIRQIYLRVNGTTYVASNGYQAPTVSDGGYASVTTDYELAATDYVEAVAFQRSGGGLNVVASANYSPEFWICRTAADVA